MNTETIEYQRRMFEKAVKTDVSGITPSSTISVPVKHTRTYRKMNSEK